MKCKKMLTIFFCLALTPLFTLKVCASESDGLKDLQEALSKGIEQAQEITDALDAGESAGSIAEMLKEIEEIDTSTLNVTDVAPKTGSLGNFDPADGNTNSPSFLFAKLQLELAEACKTNVQPYLNQINENQEEQYRVSGYLQQAQDLRTQAESEPAAMPGELQYYMDENGLSYPGTDSGLYTADDWQEIIYSLESHLESIGTNVQGSMAQIQDFMGQYNSYLQDADTTIQDAVEDLDSVSRGQSLFSPEGGQANVAPVAASILAGVLLGMFLMWLIMKKRAQKPVEESL